MSAFSALASMMTSSQTDRQENSYALPAMWWRWGILAGLIVLLYWSILGRLIAQWWTDPNFSYGFFVPLFAAFLVWQKRGSLRSLDAKPSYWGLLVIAGALGLLILGTLGAEIFLARLSFVFLISGLVLIFGGWAYCRALRFPLAFMCLMVPLPELVFSQIAFPLQIVASKAAAAILPYLGVPALREGNIINLPTMPLEVAEACSGIRSLMSLGTLAIIYGYVAETKMAIRLLLVAAAVPIAISANSIRIVGTGLLVEYWSPDKAEGFFHAFSGWLLFLASLALLLTAHKIVSRIGLSMRTWRAI